MIPREEHLKQINRFHDLYQKFDKQLEHEIDQDEKYKILKNYFELVSKVWPLVDDCIETIKDRLDRFEDSLKK